MLLERAMDLFFEGYFSTCRRSERTIRAYATDLDQFAAFLSPRQTLEGLTPEMLEEWAEELKEAGYASTSIRRKFAALKVFLSYWVRKRVLERSPAWQIRLDLAPQQVLTKALSVEEMRQLLNAAELEVRRCRRLAKKHQIDKSLLALRDLCIVEMLLVTGIRVGELTALSLDDYQADENSLRIRGKGSRERLAFIPDCFCRAYGKYRKRREMLPVSHRNLLVTPSGGSMSSGAVAVVVERLATKAHLHRRVTPHMIRHTAATLLLKAGVNLRLVQEFLGHASIVTTQRYTHVTKDVLRSVLAERNPRAVLDLRPPLPRTCSF